VTSEQADFPIEGALLVDRAEGWRAAHPGKQVIRLHFDTPQRLRRIVLRFTEAGGGRTQEYVIRWSSDGESFQDIVRQQFNFSGAATSEVEDHRVELLHVRALECEIIPDIAGGTAVASLDHLRLA